MTNIYDLNIWINTTLIAVLNTDSGPPLYSHISPFEIVASSSFGFPNPKRAQLSCQPCC